MWHVAVLIAMTALTGMYALNGTSSPRLIEDAHAARLADSMAVYRHAVTQYYNDHPATPYSVDIATLNAAGLFPEWSPLHTHPETAIWRNYINADGRIYIYAASRPAPDAITHVLKLSHNSVLAGVFRTGDITLYSPVYGDTGIPLPTAAEAGIPNGSPVWVAMRH